VILPVGALEAHGPHLPLTADQIQAEGTARSLAARTGGWVAPTLTYGVCTAARRFPGTVSLSLATLTAVSRELISEFGRNGVRRLLVLSGHAEANHMAALRTGAEEAVVAHPGLRGVVLSDYDFVYERRGIDAPSTDGHGGLLETSRVLYLAPETVGAERPIGQRGGSSFRPAPPTEAEWPESVVGDTTAASAELGARLQGHVLLRLEETVRALLPG
jgi:creatinine amidohydrolase